MNAAVAVVIVLVITIAVSIAVSLLLSWQIYLLITSQTTIEFYVFKRKSSDQTKPVNEYDLGLKENINSVFGYGHRSFISYFFPSNMPLPSDGIHWSTITSSEYDFLVPPIKSWER